MDLVHDTAALITIDVQRDTLDGGPLEIRGTSAVIPNIARLCAAFRAAELPIVHVVRLYKADGSNAEPIRRDLVRGPTPILRPGTPGRNIVAELLPDDAPELDDERLLAGHLQELAMSEHVLYKPRWGAFFKTPLEAHLHAVGARTVLFAGCNFPNCPRTSIYEAGERDLDVGLVTDAVSGLYDRGEAELTNIGVRLYRTNDVETELSRRGHRT